MSRLNMCFRSFMRRDTVTHNQQREAHSLGADQRPAGSLLPLGVIWKAKLACLQETSLVS